MPGPISNTWQSLWLCQRSHVYPDLSFPVHFHSGFLAHRCFQDDSEATGRVGTANYTRSMKQPLQGAENASHPSEQIVVNSVSRATAGHASGLEHSWSKSYSTSCLQSQPSEKQKGNYECSGNSGKHSRPQYKGLCMAAPPREGGGPSTASRRHCWDIHC